MKDHLHLEAIPEGEGNGEACMFAGGCDEEAHYMCILVEHGDKGVTFACVSHTSLMVKDYWAMENNLAKLMAKLVAASRMN